MSINEMMAKRCNVPSEENALPDRTQEIRAPKEHRIFKNKLDGLDLSTFEEVQLALGCFWGAERKFWSLPGVVYTAVGYSGGHTKNATYDDVCSGKTGHTEVVKVIFDPEKITLHDVLKVFWESHDPTQGMRQGNDVGSQYRSAIYYSDDHQKIIQSSLEHYQSCLDEKVKNAITTEVKPASAFYFAEEYHQQYLDKNPNGYCGLGGTGVCY